MKRIMFVLLIGIVSQLGYAQNLEEDVYLSVNGLVKHEKYTREEVVKALGEPDTLTSAEYNDYIYFDYMKPDMDCDMDVQSFGFDKTEDGMYMLEDVNITSDTYVLNEGIKIGSHISEIWKLPGWFSNDIDRKDGGGSVRWSGYHKAPVYEGWAYTIHFVYNEDGIIWMVYDGDLL